MKINEKSEKGGKIKFIIAKQITQRSKVVSKGQGFQPNIEISDESNYVGSSIFNCAKQNQGVRVQLPKDENG